MIKKEELEKLENLKKERESLKKRIEKLESKPRKILSDSVRGSSKEFPYVSHSCKIEGLDDSLSYRRRKNTIKKLKKMLKSKEVKISKMILNIEYELNYIDDPEIREIIRYIYEDEMTYNQAAHKMNEIKAKKEYTADSLRMKIKRFFEKNEKSY